MNEIRLIDKLSCTLAAELHFEPDSRLEAIGHRAFEDTGLEKAYLPASIGFIGHRDFAGYGFSSVIIENFKANIDITIAEDAINLSELE